MEGRGELGKRLLCRSFETNFESLVTSSSFRSKFEDDAGLLGCHGLEVVGDHVDYSLMVRKSGRTWKTHMQTTHFNYTLKLPPLKQSKKYLKQLQAFLLISNSKLESV